jgi:hypothetical protein
MEQSLLNAGAQFVSGGAEFAHCLRRVNPQLKQVCSQLEHSLLNAEEVFG